MRDPVSPAGARPFLSRMKGLMMNTQNEFNVRDALASLSREDFLSIGLNQLAYIKRQIPGTFGLYAANGHLIFETGDAKEAAIIAQQNNLHPVTVH